MYMYICIMFISVYISNPFPRIKKTPQIIPPQSFYYSGYVFSECAQNEVFLNLSNIHKKPSKINDNPKSCNNFLYYFI